MLLMLRVVPALVQRSMRVMGMIETKLLWLVAPVMVIWEGETVMMVSGQCRIEASKGIVIIIVVEVGMMGLRMTIFIAGHIARVWIERHERFDWLTRPYRTLIFSAKSETGLW